MKTLKNTHSDIRNGQILLNTVVGLIFAACSVLAFLSFSEADSSNDGDSGPVLTHTVARGDFEVVVTETGDLESASNDEVRCEVKAQGGGGTTIIEIVEEGTIVEQEDVLIRFDSSAIELSLTQQEIMVATDEAGVIDAESELLKAEKALEEYINGTFPVEKETLKGELFQAESFLKSTQDSLAHTARIFKKGYASKMQLEADQLAVEMARKAAEVSTIKLSVLDKYTYSKMVGEFEANVKKSRAMLKAAQHTLKLSQQRRDELLEQVAACEVKAPSDGQVVYANDSRRDIVIEEGVQIRQGQVVIRLPDPNQMQVDTKINDTKINKVQIGSLCEITLDVDPGLPVHGKLIHIEPFPYPRRWHGAPIEYGATVEIIDAASSLRPGQRAKVNIISDRKADVLQIPVQSVMVEGEHHFCVLKTSAGWKAHQVVVGANNDSFAVIEEGLQEGDQVALNPELLWKDVSESLPARTASE